MLFDKLEVVELPHNNLLHFPLLCREGLIAAGYNVSNRDEAMQSKFLNWPALILYMLFLRYSDKAWPGKHECLCLDEMAFCKSNRVFGP